MSQERRDEIARRMREAAQERNPLGLPIGIQPDSPSMFTSLDLDQEGLYTHAAACEAINDLFKADGNPINVIARLNPDGVQRLELERLAAEYISEGYLLTKPVKEFSSQNEFEQNESRIQFEQEEATQLAWLEQLGADE